jgi:hypothetical protein
MVRLLGLAALGLASSGCGEISSAVDGQLATVSASETATLYRNSPIADGLRLHWSTFDADDAPSYNANNCEMAARLLNANLIASAEEQGLRPHSSVGFWCESGRFDPEGQTPSIFPDEFPTDVSAADGGFGG